MSKNPIARVLENVEKRRQRHNASALNIYAVRIGEERDSPYGWPFFSFDDQSALDVMSAFPDLEGRKVFCLGNIWTDNGRMFPSRPRCVGTVPHWKDDKED